MTQRLERVKVILKYLTIFIQHFKYVEDLRINEVSKSLMTWIPESSYKSRVVPYLDEISNNYCNKNITVADSYYALLVRSSGTLTALQADHNDFEATTQIPNLNIQTKGVPHTQQMTEPKQITLVKRESHTPKQ